jgi:drug/metabolite transporter (DMT)-like permease
MNAVWMVLSGLSFSGVGVLVKYGAGQFTSAELVFHRCFWSLVFLYGIMKLRGIKVGRTNLRRHFARSLAGFVSMVLFFHAMTVLPLATATTLSYTSTLFLALFSILFLKEKAHLSQILTLGAGFVGVLILLGPSFTRGQLPDALLGLGAGLFAGIAFMNIRAMGREGEPVWNTVFYFSLISTLLSGLWALLHPLHPLAWGNIWIVTGMGFLATLGQLFLTKAYQGGQTIVTGAFNYSTILFASLFGIVLWGEILSPMAWTGMAILVGSGVVMVRLSSSRTPPPAGI